METEAEYVPMKEPKYCFVKTCKNKSTDSTKRFFSVPNTRKEEWCNAVGIKCPKRFLYICEDHLNLEEDMENYRYWLMMKVRPRLKERVPESLSPKLTIDFEIEMNETPSSSSKPVSRKRIRNGPQKTSEKVPEVLETPDTTDCASQQIKTESSPSHLSEILETADTTTYCATQEIKTESPIHVPEMLETSDAATACAEEMKIEPSFEEVMLEEYLDEESLDTAISCTNIAAVSSEEVSNVEDDNFMLKIVINKPKCYLGLPKHYFWLIDYLATKFQIKTVYIITTLYKIKNNTPFYQVADMFELSLATLRRQFFRTLTHLSMFFKQFIFCPSVLEVKKNLPSSFNTNKQYANVFCIIDCLEIEIEKPSCHTEQALTWSQNKEAYTLKYLVAMTPDGFICFVSEGFGGCISDAHLVQRSKLLDYVPPNCYILADTAFTRIESIISKKQIKLLRLPSVSNVSKLTKNKAIKRKVIASLRIHIEKVLRRIRIFKSLKPHSAINSQMIQHADDVVIVACGLVNLQSSVIKMEQTDIFTSLVL